VDEQHFPEVPELGEGEVGRPDGGAALASGDALEHNMQARLSKT
jgi:hypothetical protein